MNDPYPLLYMWIHGIAISRIVKLDDAKLLSPSHKSNLGLLTYLLVRSSATLCVWPTQVFGGEPCTPD